MNPISVLEDPDDIGQSEYRAIIDCLRDALEDAPEEDRLGLAIGMLDEFEHWAGSLKKRLKGASSKKPKSGGG